MLTADRGQNIGGRFSPEYDLQDGKREHGHGRASLAGIPDVSDGSTNIRHRCGRSGTGNLTAANVSIERRSISLYDLQVGRRAWFRYFEPRRLAG